MAASSSKSSKSVINIIDVDKYEGAKSDIHHHNIIDLDTDEDVDDFYISALYEEEDDDVLLISPEKYAQETLLSSSASKRNASSSSQRVKVALSTPPNKLKRKQPMLTSEEEEEEAAAAKVATSFCGICMDTKSLSEMFSNKKVCCRHLFCSDCIRQHVSFKIKENIAKVKCPHPKCKGVIRPEHCRSIVPKEALERWEDALCESLILGKQKFYCPFQDCSAMLVNDSGKAVTSSECPNCNRLFCAQCKVAWHSGMDCKEYKSRKKVGKDCKEYKSRKKVEVRNSDKKFKELAKKNKWMRCRNCKIYVEKVSGCDRISCRCGHIFSYKSGGRHYSCF